MPHFETWACLRYWGKSTFTRLSSLPELAFGLGHDVGRHYDLKALEKNFLASSEILLAELALLIKLSGKEVMGISAHNPGSTPFDPIKESKSRFVHANHSKFTNDFSYILDSCGAWRDLAFFGPMRASV